MMNCSSVTSTTPSYVILRDTDVPSSDEVLGHMAERQISPDEEEKRLQKLDVA